MTTNLLARLSRRRRHQSRTEAGRRQNRAVPQLESIESRTLLSIYGISVPGTANPFLADPANTPGADPLDGTMPPSVPVVGGMTYTFNVSGFTGNFPAGSFAPDPDGIQSIYQNATFGPRGGISDYRLPLNSLIGVFRGPTVGARPAALDSSISFTGRSPQLGQVFFIGDGLTGTGTGERQVFHSPIGATDLFLASLDGHEWGNNAGSFTVDIVDDWTAASPGQLEPAVVGGGRILTDVGSAFDEDIGVARQPDGNIVVVGSTGPERGPRNVLIARYRPDGQLDPNFNGGAPVVTDFGGDDVATSVAIQDDGKIVIAGYTKGAQRSDFALARYLPNGALDTSFDGDGKVILDLGGDRDDALSVLIQPDGKIVAVGIATNDTSWPSARFALVRFDSSGQLDTSFGTGGVVTTHYQSNLTYAATALLQPDGKIIAAGTSYVDSTATGYDCVIARYLPNGALDPSFRGGIFATSLAPGSDQIHALALQPDGKIVATGYVYTPATGTDVALIRYNPDGTLDSSFDGDGIVQKGIAAGNGYDYGNALAIQPNGKIVVAGQTATTTTGVDFAVLRYNVDGTLDQTFDGDGIQTTDFAGANDQAYGVALEPDGTIISAGTARRGSNTDFALAFHRGDLPLGVVIRDNFNDNSLDTQKWATNTSIGSVSESNGRLELANRGYLISQRQIDPLSDGALHIQGRWTFTNATWPGHDSVNFVTRSDGQPGGGSGEVRNGVVFIINGNDFIIINEYVDGVGRTLAGPTPITVNNGDSLDFEIRDDGVNVVFLARKVGGDGATASLAGATARRFSTNHVVVYNREVNNGYSTLGFLDDFTIASSPLLCDVVNVSPDPRTTPVDSIPIEFSKLVTGFTTADLSLTRDGTTVSLSGATLSGSARSYTLSNLSSLTGSTGSYTLQVNLAGVIGAHGDPGIGAVVDSWTVDPVPLYSPAILADSPRGYWRLGESSGTTASDSSGNNRHGTYLNGVALGLTGALAGDPNTAAGFDSTNDQISVPDTPSLRPTQLTVEAWVYRDTSTQDYDSVLMKTSSGQWTDGFGLYSFGGNIAFFVNHYAAGRVMAPIANNAWTHVAGSYDGANLRLYTNGILAATVPYSSPINNSIQPLLIGAGNGGYSWGGRLDEVAVYGAALSPARVAAHYQTGTGGTVAPSLSINDVSVVEGNSGTVNARFTVTLSAASTQTVTVQYQTANGTATAPSDYAAIGLTTLTFAPGETIKTFDVVVNGDTTVESNETFLVNLSNPTNATIDDNQGVGTITNDDLSNAYQDVILADTPSGYWRLGESTGATVASDSSGNNRHGAYQNGVALGLNGAVAGDPNTAAGFDADNDRITIPDAPSLRFAQLTVEAWVYRDASTQDYDSVLMKTSSGQWTDGFGLYSFGGNIAFFVNHYAAGRVMAPIANNAWTHVAGTYDGANLRLYTNGILAATVPYSTALSNSLAPLSIGAGNGGFTWGGRLDEVAVYGAALNPARVAAHHQAGIGGPVSPSLSINDVSVVEGNSGTVNARFTVTLSAASTQTVTVQYQTANGTATAPSDYAAIGLTTLTFAPGETIKTFDVVVNGDTTVEPNETFLVNLSNPTNATIADDQGVGTITNDDSSTGYRDSVLADSPAGYWRLGETSGTAAYDASGNNRHGSYLNGVLLGLSGALTTDTDKAAGFDSGDDNVEILDNAAFRPSTQITLEAWVYRDSTINDYDAVLMKSSSGKWDDGYGLYYQGGNIVGFVNHWNTTKVQAALPALTWKHVVMTYDSSNLRLYLDGVLISTLPSTAAITHVSAVPLLIGRGAGGFHWGGRLDEVAVYGTALSATRIADHFGTGKQSPPPRGGDPKGGSGGDLDGLPQRDSSSAGVSPSELLASAAVPDFLRDFEQALDLSIKRARRTLASLGR